MSRCSDERNGVSAAHLAAIIRTARSGENSSRVCIAKVAL